METESPRPARRHGRSRGQTIVIFVLSLGVLLGFAGLAIDVLRAYDLYAHEQRAAEAGALAGLLYLPHNYNTAAPAPADRHSGASRAMIEVAKNGYGPAPPGPVIAHPRPSP